MDKNSIELDILRKEYEGIVKSIDEQSKYIHSLLPVTLGVFTLMATLCIGLYNKQTSKALNSIVEDNWQFLSFFLSLIISLLVYYLLINRQEITIKTVYKEYLEKQINHHLDRPILIWNSSVLKKTDLLPYSIGVMDIIVIIISFVIILSFALYALNNSSAQSSGMLSLIAAIMFGFWCWLIYIITLPIRLNKYLYRRSII